MDLLNNRRVVVVGAGMALATIVLATMTYRALSVREPPLEAEGDAGLRIRLVEPPKAPFKAGGLLEVGVSGASRAQATARASTVNAPIAGSRHLAPEPKEERIDMAQADAASDAGADAADLADREGAWRDRQAREARRAWAAEQRDAEIHAERYAPPLEDPGPPPDDR